MMPIDERSLARSGRRPRLAGIALALATATAIGLPPGTDAAPARTVTAQVGEGRAERLTIAGCPAFALLDGTIRTPNDGQSFVLSASIADTSRMLRAHGVPADHFDLAIQPVLLRVPGRVLLFDAGAGTNMGDEGGRPPASLVLAGVPPPAVTDIFISHAHGDHVGGLLAADNRPAFPNATIHIARAEWAWLRGMSNADAAKVVIRNHAALVAIMAPHVATFEPDAPLIGGVVRAVAIPGHTPGHSGYLIRSGSRSVLYIGDAMHHFVTSVAHPEWRIAFDKDADRAARSRVTDDARWVARRQRIYAVHFPFPGYGIIVREGSSYRWRSLPKSKHDGLFRAVNDAQSRSPSVSA